MVEFKGKLLIRRATTTDGKSVLVVTGVVEPNCPIDKFDPKDEMWAAHLLVLDSVRFVNEAGHHFSPEDFIENVNGIQDAGKWTRDA